MSKEMLEMAKMPEVKFTKSGFEIRADILKQAQDLAAQEFQYKWHGWEMSGKRDEKTGQFVTSVEMPTYPGLDQILANAAKMYEFVNTSKNR
jgi:hypothetical protein